MMSWQREEQPTSLFSAFLFNNFWIDCLWAIEEFSLSWIRRFIVPLFVYEFADDPYYCGLRARVSNFVKNKNTNEKPVKELGTEIKMKMTPHVGTYQAALSHGHPMQTHQMWHSRSFDSGMGNWVWQLFLMHKLFERSQRKSFIPGWHVLWYYGVALNHEIFFYVLLLYSHTKKHIWYKLSLSFGWHPPQPRHFHPHGCYIFNITSQKEDNDHKRGENMKLPIFQSKENIFFFFSFAYTQRIQSSNREKGNRQKRKNGFPFLLILFPLAFSRFSYAKRTASLPSSVTPDIQRLWKAYPFERNPTSWVPSHPHGYSPGESFPPVPIPYRTLWIPP